MSAEYDFRQTPGTGNDDEPPILHPRIVTKGTITTERIARDLSAISTFTVGDVEGLLAGLEDQIVSYLEQGYRVKIGEIGHLSLKLKSRPVTDPKKIRSMSIAVDNVNFVPTASFKKRVKGISVSRARNGFASSSFISDEQRLEKLRKHFETNAFITRRDYSSKTGLLKSQALRSIREMVAGGYLVKDGYGTHVVYLKGEKL